MNIDSSNYLLFSPDEDLKRFNKVKEIIKELGVSEKYLIETLKHNSEQPYHNFQHLFTVAIQTFEGAKFKKVKEKQIRLLVIAALLHDLGHYGDTRVDQLNILQTLKIAKPILEEDTSLSKRDIRKILYYIFGTESSGKNYAQGVKGRYQDILNESDVMQCIEPDSELWIEALSKEHDTEITIGTTKEFLRNYNFRTKYANNRVNEFLAAAN